MRTKVITLAIATGVVVTALIATPMIAVAMRSGDPAPDGTGSGTRTSETTAGVPGERGMGNRNGTGAASTTVASGTVTADQAADLAAMASEEKLAHDLYVAFDAQYDAAVFTRIARSETKHIEAVTTLLEHYDIASPIVGLAPGVFSSEVTQDLYDTLLADGSVNLAAAKEAARTVEEMDIADLTLAVEGVTAPDVLNVYEHLLAGSENHLVAFGG